jgi:hypothetical protein
MDIGGMPFTVAPEDTETAAANLPESPDDP